MFYEYPPRQTPTLLPVPEQVLGYQLHIKLLDASPAVWRVVPGSITLPELHMVVQGAMGWTNSHLHEFSVGTGYDAPVFVNDYDIDQGEEGLGEAGVRLDQVLSDVGDVLTYVYDFGDNWRHEIKVEKLLDKAPKRPRVTAGRYSCPPEDVGSTPGHNQVAEWVLNDYDPELLPEGFESTRHGFLWLGFWHPDEFNLKLANAEITESLAYIE